MKFIPIVLLTNPFLWAIIISSTGLLQTVISPRWYEYILGEQNYMYGYMLLWQYVIICMLSFTVFGYFSTVFCNTIFRKRYDSSISLYKDVKAAKLLLNIIIFLNIISILYLQTTIGISRLIVGTFSGNAASLRLDVANQIADGRFGFISPLSVPVLLWGFWTLLRNENHDFKKLYILAILLYTINTLLSLTRGPIFEISLSLLVIYILQRYSDGTFNAIKLFKRIAFAGTLLVIFFLGVNQLRSGGEVNNNSSASGILGYGPASYNRLAAVMKGQLVYPDSNVGFYTMQGIWDLPLISNQMYKFGRDIGINLPENGRENWLNQFLYVRYAGLRPDFIWETAFGFAWSDWQWFGAVYFAISGIITGILYILFRKGHIFGIMVYPYSLLAVLGWGSALTLSQRSFFIYLFAAFSIVIIRHFFASREQHLFRLEREL